MHHFILFLLLVTHTHSWYMHRQQIVVQYFSQRAEQQTSHTRFFFSCTFCEISSNAEHVTNTLSHFLSDISVWKCFKNTAIIPSPHWAWKISVSLYIIICGRLFKLPVHILFKRKQWDNSKYQGNFILYLIEFCPFWLLLTLLRLSSGSFNF